MASISGYVDFPIFALFSKTFEKPTPPTIFVKYSSKSLEMIFRPSLTKNIHRILILTTCDPHIRVCGTATQSQQKSRQTGSEVISKQIFEILTFFPFFTLLSFFYSSFFSSSFL